MVQQRRGDVNGAPGHSTKPSTPINVAGPRTLRPWLPRFQNHFAIWMPWTAPSSNPMGVYLAHYQVQMREQRRRPWPYPIITTQCMNVFYPDATGGDEVGEAI